MIKTPQWFTVEDAAQYLTEKLKEKVLPQDLFWLALEGELKLSLNFQNDVVARKVKVVKSQRKILLYKYETFTPENMNLYLGGDTFPHRYIDYAKPIDKHLVPIQGIQDLSLLGEDRHLVDTQYCVYSNITPPGRKANQAHGIILDLGESGLHQVQVRMDVRAVVESLWAKAKQFHIPDRLAKKLIDRFSKLKSINIPDEEAWRRYIPAHLLPPDAFFVIRKVVLDDFIKQTPAPELLPVANKPSSRTVNRQNQTIYSLLVVKFGEEVADNPRRHFENPNGVVRKAFELKGLPVPSGQAVERWLKDI